MGVASACPLGSQQFDVIVAFFVGECGVRREKYGALLEERSCL